MTYAFSRIRTTGPSFQPALQGLSHDGDAALAPAVRWGAFFGLFGLRSNEFFLVTSGDVGGIGALLAGRDDVEDSTTLLLEPTARPTSTAPMTREGLYVFRFFDVAHTDVAEIAALSKQAWEHFEVTDDYKAEPQALFCESDPSDAHGKMLLVTWYDGLNSWQTSRSPHPDATANFRKRQALTQGTIAFATRLITP